MRSTGEVQQALKQPATAVTLTTTQPILTTSSAAKETEIVGKITYNSDTSTFHYEYLSQGASYACLLAGPKFKNFCETLKIATSAAEKRAEGKNWIEVGVETLKDLLIDGLGTLALSAIFGARRATPVGLFLEVLTPTSTSSTDIIYPRQMEIQSEKYLSAKKFLEIVDRNSIKATLTAKSPLAEAKPTALTTSRPVLQEVKSIVAQENSSLAREQQQTQLYLTKLKEHPLYKSKGDIGVLETHYLGLIDEAAKNLNRQRNKNKVVTQSQIVDQKTVGEITKQKQVLSQKIKEFKVTKAAAEMFGRQEHKNQKIQLQEIADNAIHIGSICKDVSQIMGKLGGDVETAEKLMHVGQAVTTIASNTKVLSAVPLKFDLSTFNNCANFTLGVIQLGVALFGMDDEEDERFTEIFHQLQQIFEAVKMVSQQVMDLHIEMRDSFKKLYNQLDLFQKNMQDRLERQDRLLLHSLELAHWADTKSDIMWDSIKDAALLGVFQELRVNRDSILNPSIAGYLENIEAKDYLNRSHQLEEWLVSTSASPIYNGYDATKKGVVSDRIIQDQLNEDLTPEKFYSKLGLMASIAKGLKQEFKNSEKLINPSIWGMAISPYLTLLMKANPIIPRNIKHNQEKLELIIDKAKEVQAFLKWIKESALFEALWNQYTNALKEVSEQFVNKLRKQEDQLAYDLKLSDSKQALTGLLTEDLRVLDKSRSLFADRIPKDNVAKVLGGLNYQEKLSTHSFAGEVKRYNYEVKERCSFSVPFMFPDGLAELYAAPGSIKRDSKWYNTYTSDIPKYIDQIQAQNKTAKDQWISPYLRLVSWLQSDILNKDIEINLTDLGHVSFGIDTVKTTVKLKIYVNKNLIATIGTSHTSYIPLRNTWINGAAKAIVDINETKIENLTSVQNKCLDIINQKLQSYRARAIGETLTDFVVPVKELKFEGPLLKLESARLQLEAFLKLLTVEVPKCKLRTGLQYMTWLEKMAAATLDHVTWQQGIEWITDTKSSSDLNILNAIKSAVAGKDLSKHLLHRVMSEYTMALEEAKKELASDVKASPVNQQQSSVAKATAASDLARRDLTENQLGHLKDAHETCIECLEILIKHPKADELVKQKSNAIVKKIKAFEKNNQFTLQDTEIYLNNLKSHIMLLGDKIKSCCSDKESLLNSIKVEIDSVFKLIVVESSPSFASTASTAPVKPEVVAAVAAPAQIAQATTHCDKGITLFYAKDYSGALNRIEKALQLNPEYADAFCVRGSCLRDTNKIAEALIAFDHSIRLLNTNNPMAGWFYYNRALAYKILNDHQKVLSDCNKFLEFCPGNSSGIALRDQAAIQLSAKPAVAAAVAGMFSGSLATTAATITKEEKGDRKSNNP